MADQRISEFTDGGQPQDIDDVPIERGGTPTTPGTNFKLVWTNVRAWLEARFAPLAHVSDTGNPHSVTASQVNAIPDVATADGDLFSFDGTNYTRLAVGADGTNLTARPGAGQGLKLVWEVGSGGGISPGDPWVVGDIMAAESVSSAETVGFAASDIARLSQANAFTDLIFLNSPGASLRVGDGTSGASMRFLSGGPTDEAKYNIGVSSAGELSISELDDAETTFKNVLDFNRDPTQLVINVSSKDISSGDAYVRIDADTSAWPKIAVLEVINNTIGAAIKLKPGLNSDTADQRQFIFSAVSGAFRISAENDSNAVQANWASVAWADGIDHRKSGFDLRKDGTYPNETNGKLAISVDRGAGNMALLNDGDIDAVRVLVGGVEVYHPGNPPPGGGVTNPPSIKGDLWTFHTASTQRLPVGANGQALVANSVATEGIEWANTANSVFSRTGNVVAQAGDYTAAQVTNAADITATNVFQQDQRIQKATDIILDLYQTGVASEAGRWYVSAANGVYTIHSRNNSGTPAATNPEIGIGHDNFIGGQGVILGAATFQGQHTLNAENGVFDSGNRALSVAGNQTVAGGGFAATAVVLSSFPATLQLLTSGNHYRFDPAVTAGGQVNAQGQSGYAIVSIPAAVTGSVVAGGATEVVGSDRPGENRCLQFIHDGTTIVAYHL